jgi:hypothetical protein
LLSPGHFFVGGNEGMDRMNASYSFILSSCAWCGSADTHVKENGNRTWSAVLVLR